MVRFLNIVAILVLMGSAVYAYTIKYETAYRAEQLAKTKIEIKQERDAIAVLKAEWAFMTRPERLQQLADAHLRDMKPLAATQIILARQTPDKAPHVDSIGQKLDALIGDAAAPDQEPEAKPTPARPAPPKPVAAKPAAKDAAPKNTTPKSAASSNSTKTSTAAKAPPSGQKKL